MTGSEGISIALLISVVSIVCVVINTYSGGKKRKTDEIEAENNRKIEIEKQFVKVNLKLDEFCNSLNELIRKQDKTAEELQDIKQKLIKDNIRLDDHEKRITELEKG